MGNVLSRRGVLAGALMAAGSVLAATTLSGCADLSVDFLSIEALRDSSFVYVRAFFDITNNTSGDLSIESVVRVTDGSGREVYRDAEVRVFRPGNRCTCFWVEIPSREVPPGLDLTVHLEIQGVSGSRSLTNVPSGRLTECGTSCYGSP